MKRLLLSAILSVFAVAMVGARAEPASAPSDHRIRSLLYEPSQVV